MPWPHGDAVTWNLCACPCAPQQDPSELLKKRAVPHKVQLKHGPLGVPFVGSERVRVDKKLSKQLHRRTVTEILRDGLQVTDVVPGKGPAAAWGDTVRVHYVGKLAASGKQFDAGTLTFKVGAGKVIRGWDQGIQGLHAGGTRMLHVPPQLAYGAKGTPGGPIPPHSTLLFSVKLLHVQKARHDIKKKGLQHRKIKHPVARTAKHGKMLHRGPWWPFRPRHKMGAKAAQRSKQQHLRRAHAH